MNRVVVTGMGIVSPLGNDVPTFWENVKNGCCGIAPITKFDTTDYKVKVAAEVKDFDPRAYMEKMDVLHSDIYTQFAVAAATQAVEESGIIGTVRDERIGVYIGTGIGGIQTFMDEHKKLMEKGPRKVSPFFIPMMIANMASGMIAMRYQCKGAALVDSQSFDALWKRLGKAESLDQPKTQQEILDSIIGKAEKERKYGHLLKAMLKKVDAVTAVTPDSLKPEIDRLGAKEKTFANTDPVLAAVWRSVLGSVYKANPSVDENAETISSNYFRQSLENPDQLAATQSEGWVPLLNIESGSKYFGNDLLSVLAFQAEDYDMLYGYYDQHGKREAACLAACYMLRNHAGEYKKKAAGSEYLRMVEEMIERYKDLEMAGELALVKYEFLEEASDVKAAELIEWIDKACATWPRWERINRLKNSRESLTQPSFSLTFGSKVVLPEHERVIKLEQLRHLKSVSMRVARVNLDPRKQYRLYNKKDLETVTKAIVNGSSFTVDRPLASHPEYEFFSDSITLPPLKRGIYLAEFFTNEENIETARTLFYVSDVMLLTQSMPDNQIRLAAVSATTGKPLKKATLSIKKYKNDTLISFVF